MRTLEEKVKEALGAGLTQSGLIKMLRMLADEYDKGAEVLTCSTCDGVFYKSELINGDVCPLCGGTDFYTTVKL